MSSQRLEQMIAALELGPYLRPIVGDAPGGSPTWDDPRVEIIEEARREDAPQLPQGVWKFERKTADWPTVAGACTRILVQTSKDLRVAAWLSEAWIACEGWRGLQRGLLLLAGLVDRFWADAHPDLEAEGLDARLAPIRWLIEVAARRLGCRAIVGLELSLDDWRHAQRLDLLRVRDKQAAEQLESEGKLDTAAFVARLREASLVEIGRLYAELQAAIDACEVLEATLDASIATTLGHHDVAGESPSFRRLSDLGDQLVALLERHFELPPESSAPVEPGAAPEPEAARSPQPAASAEPRPALGLDELCNRDQAYRALATIADYLERTEPHSPSPYLIRRVVAWGGMSLDRLLPELIDRPDDLAAISTLLRLSVISQPNHED